MVVKALLIAAGSAAAILLPSQLPLSGGGEEQAVRNPRQPGEQADTAKHLSDFGDSLEFVGVCSVACSLIGGTAVIVVARNRRKQRCTRN